MIAAKSEVTASCGGARSDASVIRANKRVYCANIFLPENGKILNEMCLLGRRPGMYGIPEITYRR